MSNAPAKRPWWRSADLYWITAVLAIPLGYFALHVVPIGDIRRVHVYTGQIDYVRTVFGVPISVTVRTPAAVPQPASRDAVKLDTGFRQFTKGFHGYNIVTSLTAYYEQWSYIMNDNGVSQEAQDLVFVWFGDLLLREGRSVDILPSANTEGDIVSEYFVEVHGTPQIFRLDTKTADVTRIPLLP